MPLKKGDLRFHVQSIRLASRWKAARYAVFTSLLTPSWKDENKGVGWALDLIYHMWRARLDGLRDAGWGPIQDDTSFTYMRNCPPFGVTTVLNKQRRCKRLLLCPFCYARDYVVKAFIRLETFAFGGLDPTTNGTGWKEPPARLRMVEYNHKSTIRPTVPRYNPALIEEDLCETIRKYFKSRRRREFDMLHGECGVNLLRVAPVENGIRVWVSGIVLTRTAAPQSLRPRDVSAKNYRFIDHKEWDKTRLARACGRVFSYPKAMLLAQPDDVVALLNGLRRVRMLTSYQRILKVDLKSPPGKKGGSQ